MIKHILKKAVLILFNITFLVVEAIAKTGTRVLRKSTPVNPQPSGIIILFITAIGDYVLFTTILRVIINQYKDEHVTIAATGILGEFIDNLPNVDEYIVTNKSWYNKKPIYRFRLLYRLRSRTYRVALYPSFSRTDVGDHIMRFIHASEKIGYDGDTATITEKEKRKNDRIYTQLVKAPEGVSKEIEYYQHLGLALGLKEEDISSPWLLIDKTTKDAANQLLQRHGVRSNYVVMGPGAGYNIRVWTIEGYRQVCTYLYQKGYQVILVGNKQEQYLAEQIVNELDTTVINLVGQTSLLELAAICQGAKLYVGTESGPLQIAIAAGIPTVGIMGGGQAFRFYPYGDPQKHVAVYLEMDCFGCNWKCIHPYVKCIQDIPTSRVTAALDGVLIYARDGVGP